MSLSAPALSAPRLGLRTRATPQWWLNREAALSWLALGLLLGAWNAADDGAPVKPRPAPLRGYEAVSVRALQRSHPEP